MPSKKKQTFEQKLEHLAVLVEKVEDSTTPLESAVSLYKEGIALAKDCAKVLQAFETQVVLLQKEAGED
jgi:exodeoxyribonuclease VII small subunit